MKRLFFLLLVCTAQISVQAQVPTQDPYPNIVATATNINRYAFFIDSVSSVNEQALGFVAAGSNVTAATSINLAGISSGVHQLYAKVTATDGTPSITNMGTFFMEGNTFYPNAVAVPTQINTYSFFIDSVSNVNEQLLNFAASNTNTTASTAINLTGTSSGVHQLYAKVTATNGTPSITNIGTFYMEGNTLYPNAAAAATQINRYEFFVDSVSDVNVQAVSFTAASQNTSPATSIDLIGVSPGIHNLYARVYDINNVPGITNIGQFAMEQNFRYADVAAPAPALQNLEYYIDTDPGYGLGTAISISGTNTTEILSNISIAIPTALPGGIHYLHIRSRQNPWSIDNALPFEVGTVLPVTWLYVKAQLVNETTLLEWATASELNTGSYEIEWSTDGITFTKAGSVNAAGNSNSNRSYSFTHSSPLDGLNYYRIKQVDLDGRYKYSVIVKVLKQQNSRLSIYPNPATSYIQLNLASNKDVLIRIFDTQGKLVNSTRSNNQSILKIDVSLLSKGNYIVQVSDGASLQTGNFIKQ